VIKRYASFVNFFLQAVKQVCGHEKKISALAPVTKLCRASDTDKVRCIQKIFFKLMLTRQGIANPERK
jgi:hypothetical protein